MMKRRARGAPGALRVNRAADSSEERMQEIARAGTVPGLRGRRRQS